MILDIIIESTKKRVSEAKKNILPKEIEQKAYDVTTGSDFEAALKNKFSFICEVKKASPSKGVIAEHFPYVEIAKDYEEAGAAAISVLTEPEFFQGSNDYLTEIRKNVNLPLLRKDFTIDEYQIYEAKAIGADAILLICAILDSKTISRYLDICKELNMSALVEAHDATEVARALKSGAKIIGVNNRNLKNFNVDICNCVRLRSLVPNDVIFVAESGIHTAEDVKLVNQGGVNAILIGEAMMKQQDKKSFMKNLTALI